MSGTVRHSIRRTDQSDLVRRFVETAKKSVSKDTRDEPVLSKSYEELISYAKRCVGYGDVEGAFPEEWDAQLLMDCGRTESGYRLVLFCPQFLTHVLDDPDELDHALRFILLAMDTIAMYEEYVFVYCYLGLDWSDPRLSQRLRFAYDILPSTYSKHLKQMYILHVTSGFKITMWSFRFWIGQRLWSKIEYVESLEALCKLLHPSSEAARMELRRRFPQVVQRRDAELTGAEPPVTFGVPIMQLCSGFGVDFTDKTTGRWYPLLPPVLVFLCEVMEREGAEEDFCNMYSAEATSIYKLVETVDHGKPLERDIPTPTLWCVLKLFLDCLPSPLLSFQALDELQMRKVTTDDIDAQRTFLVDTLRHQLPREVAYVTLYLASFLHTLCETAQRKLIANKSDESRGKEDDGRVFLTYNLAAKVFTSNFIRPMRMSEDCRQQLQAATAVVETLIRGAEEPEYWIGRQAAPQWKKIGRESSSSSDEGVQVEPKKDVLAHRTEDNDFAAGLDSDK